MNRYSIERREAVLKKLLPPHNLSVAEVARSENISAQTLYTWRKQAKEQGIPVPGHSKTSEQWSADAKLAIVIATASFSESELSQYCREKGLYPDQVKQWKQDCLTGMTAAPTQRIQDRQQSKADKKQIRRLEKELKRKEKALAEAAALLVLRKKLRAFYGEENEDD